MKLKRAIQEERTTSEERATPAERTEAHERARRHKRTMEEERTLTNTPPAAAPTIPRDHMHTAFSERCRRGLYRR